MLRGFATSKLFKIKPVLLLTLFVKFIFRFVHLLLEYSTSQILPIHPPAGLPNVNIMSSAHTDHCIVGKYSHQTTSFIHEYCTVLLKFIKWSLSMQCTTLVIISSWQILNQEDLFTVRKCQCLIVNKGVLNVGGLNVEISFI